MIADEFTIIIPLNKSIVCQTLFIINIKRQETLEIVFDIRTNLGLCCKDKNLMQRINKTDNMPRLSNYCCHGNATILSICTVVAVQVAVNNRALLNVAM